MKKTSFLFLFVILAVFSVLLGSRFFPLSEQVRAQTTPTTAEERLDLRVGQFFRDLQSNTPGGTVFADFFRDGSQVVRTASDAVETMSSRYTDLILDIGRLHDFEKIESQTFGNDVIVLRYISKHDNAPVLWSFRFYRPPRPTSTATSTPPSSPSGSTWNLILVRFDTNFEI